MMKCEEFEDQYKKFRKAMKFLEWTIVQYFVRFMMWRKSWFEREIKVTKIYRSNYYASHFFTCRR